MTIRELKINDQVLMANSAGAGHYGIVIDLGEDVRIKMRINNEELVVARSRIEWIDNEWRCWPENRTTLTDGSQVYPGHKELRPDGQQKDYVVLSAEERAKGFVRPVRHSYVHEKCGGVTKMGTALAETYARDPYFYSGTFCVNCGTHYPVGPKGEFVWEGTNIKVGV